MRDLWALITLTCPVAIAGKHFPLSMYLVMVANAATYALAGVIVVAARRQLHPAK